MNLENKLKTMYVVGVACLALAAGCGKKAENGEKSMSVGEIAEAVEKEVGYDLSTPEKAVEHYFTCLNKGDFEIAGRAVLEFRGSSNIKESMEEMREMNKEKVRLKDISNVKYVNGDWGLEATLDVETRYKGEDGKLVEVKVPFRAFKVDEKNVKDIKKDTPNSLGKMYASPGNWLVMW